MAFPTNPVNGQQATVNGVIYTYVSATPAWSVTTNAGANVSANNISAVAAITGATVSASGNIVGSYILGNGSLLTGVAASYGNSNVAAYLTTYTGNIAGGNLSITGTVTATTLTETSSIMFKENIRPLENSLDVIGQLAGVMYDLRDGSVKDDIGLIAEEVYKIAPSLVSLNAEGKPHALKYPRISAYLIESIKDLQIQINQLKKG